MLHSCLYFLFRETLPSLLVSLSTHEDTNSLRPFLDQPLEFAPINKTIYIHRHSSSSLQSYGLVSPSCCIKIPGTSSKSSFSISPSCDITLQLISLSTSACWASRILGCILYKKRDGPEAFKVKQMNKSTAEMCFRMQLVFDKTTAVHPFR